MSARFSIYRLENFKERVEKELDPIKKANMTNLFVRHELPLIIDELWGMEGSNNGKATERITQS